MPTVELEIMFQFVFAIKDSLVILSQVATDQQQLLQDQKLLIHADQVLVELMQNVEKEMEQPPAHAYQDSMEILMWNVIQNPEFLASHHLVGSMLNALEDTDQHHVSASLITLEIPMLLVDQNVQSTLTVTQAKNVNNYIALIPALELVEQMQIAGWKIIIQLALVKKDTLEILSQHAD